MGREKAWLRSGENGKRWLRPGGRAHHLLRTVTASHGTLGCTSPLRHSSPSPKLQSQHKKNDINEHSTGCWETIAGQRRLGNWQSECSMVHGEILGRNGRAEWKQVKSKKHRLWLTGRNVWMLLSLNLYYLFCKLSISLQLLQIKTLA